VEGRNTCECGRVWELTQRRKSQRDKDDISCYCGPDAGELERWMRLEAKLISKVQNLK
jgi:hypothetical protein